MTQNILFIVGPTGVGKSAAGMCLARNTGGEIVSCDAMQVYREINVACDKPSGYDRASVPHHMIDVVSVTEEFDVSKYRAQAASAVEDILTRGKLPIVVGGSGLYMSVLLDGIFDGGSKNDELRRDLEERAAVPEGCRELHGQLAAQDPDAAAQIHPNDAKRIVRALEVVITTGAPISALRRQRAGFSGKYNVHVYGIERPRAEMYRRAEARIDHMFAHGLVDEVASLDGLPLSRTAATLIGVPEVKGYIKGDYDIERAKYLMKLNTRHYVKRQMTWFRRDQRVQWINAGPQDGPQEIVRKMSYA